MALLHDTIAHPQRIRTIRPARGRIARQSFAPRRIELVEDEGDARLGIWAAIIVISATVSIIAVAGLYAYLTFLRPLDAASQLLGDVAGVLVSQPKSETTSYQAEKAFQAAQSRLTRDLANRASDDVIKADRNAVAIRLQAFKSALDQR